MLRLCFNCRSGLTLCVEEVRLRIFRENQLSLFATALAESSYPLGQLCVSLHRLCTVYIDGVIVIWHHLSYSMLEWDVSNAHTFQGQ